MSILSMTFFKNNNFMPISFLGLDYMSLLGRSKVTFDPKVSHFATVPKSVYRGKVTLGHLVDDCGTL